MAQASRSNWLDQWRLLFASLVILSHSFELIDGNRHRELIHRAFGQTSFGEVAVAGFFVLSGYLITKSWRATPQFGPYLRNRFLRIWPAYAVAFAVSVFVVGPLAADAPSAYLEAIPWASNLSRLIFLDAPDAPRWIFPGHPEPFLNGAMWTLKYEFLCYLLTPLLVWRRSVLIAAWVVAAVLGVGFGWVMPRFIMLFLGGAALYVFDIRPNRWALTVAVVGLVSLMFTPAWALGISLFGSYLVLSLGLRPSPLRLPDISYGVYLYGWPVQKLLIFWGVTEPWRLFALSLPAAMLLGLASCYLVERPALRWRHTATPTLTPVREPLHAR